MPPNATPSPSSDVEQLHSLTRGLAVVRALAGAAPGLTIAETAERASITRAGARRVLHTLAALGYVRQDGRRFALTPRVLDLGMGLFAARPLWGVADDIVPDLCRRLGETTSLAVLDGTDVVYVLRENPPQRLALAVGVGFRLPAHLSSMGWVLLADRPDWQREAHLRRVAIEPLTPRTIVDPATLLSAIARAGDDGFAYTEATVDEGVAGIAVPVRGPDGRAVASLGIGTRVGRYGREGAIAQLLPPLRSAATEIEGRLAMVPPARPT